MNRFARAGIAVALLAGVLWAGGVAEARRLPNAVAVCFDASSGVASRVASTANCVGGKQFWSASKSAPLLCWDASSLKPRDKTRLVSVAAASGCAAPLRAVPVNKVLLLCADGKSGVLRWSVTKACASGNRQVWIRSAATVAATTTTVTTTTTTTVTPTTTTTVAPTTTTVAPTTTTVALTCAQGGVCAVGNDGPGGGKVFYVHASGTFACGATLSQNCKYLEAAPSDLSTKVWATTDEMCYNTDGSNNGNCQTTSVYSGISAVRDSSRTASSAIGMGMANTEGFAGRLAGYPSNSTNFAAGVAWAYTNNSKTDWFLPSKDELNQLCRYAWNLTVDNTATTCTGMSGTIRTGFSTGGYWSSSEINVEGASYQDFSLGGQDYGYKGDALYVRPVRAG